jgi:formylglycine-generating enzyme required for sulfatase activity
MAAPCFFHGAVFFAARLPNVLRLCRYAQFFNHNFLTQNDKTTKQMKKILISLFSLLLLAAATTTAQESKPKLAVFVVGMDDWKRGDVVAHIVGEDLNRNKSYQVVTRSGAVQAKLKALRRASGGVSGCDIRSWGRAHGVAYVCLITSPDNQNFSAQLFDVSSPLMQCSSSSISGFGAVDLKELAWTLTTELRSGCSATCGGYCDPEAGVEMVCVEGQGATFWIGKYEITQGQWEKVMGISLTEHCQNIGTTDFRGVGPDYPMYWVDWYKSNAFCDTLSARTGKKYRLPTASEWLYAARGGNKSNGYIHSGSDSINDVGWHRDNSGGTTHAVGAKLGNELGIFDMSGNVWEWCSSKYQGSSTTPLPPANSSLRDVRGASWKEPLTTTISYPGNDYPYERFNDEGFRVVLIWP